MRAARAARVRADAAMIRFPQFRGVTWVSAFALSLGAVAGLIALEAGALLVAGVELFPPPATRVSVTDMAWCDTQRVGVATFWTGLAGRTVRYESSATLIEPDSPIEEPDNIWPGLKPRRLALAGEGR